MPISGRSAQQSIARIVCSTATTRTPYMRCCQTFLGSRTATFAEATAYELWAAANGLGAWDETDALGIHNVFRYAFDKPAGAFENPPLLSIHFENGAPVVVTPPLVNTDGYTFGLLAYDALTNANPSAYWLLSPDGTNAVTGELPARFFRLGAEEGDIGVIK